VRFHFPFQRIELLLQFRQRGSVALLQFLDPAGKSLSEALDLAVEGGPDRGKPLVAHHEGLDVGFGELAVLGEDVGVERDLGILDGDISFRLGFDEFQAAR
jgi:hypothetical protein